MLLIHTGPFNAVGILFGVAFISWAQRADHVERGTAHAMVISSSLIGQIVS